MEKPEHKREMWRERKAERERKNDDISQASEGQIGMVNKRSKKINSYAEENRNTSL